MTKILIDRIKDSSTQIRSSLNMDTLDELANSMKISGQITPIVVRLIYGGFMNNRQDYEVVVGQRRFEAAKKLNWLQIDAVVTNLTEKEAIFASFQDNIHREDLSNKDSSKWIRKLMKSRGLSTEEAAKLLGISEIKLTSFLDDQ